MGKWADEGDGLNVDSVGLVQFLTRCWPLTFSGHSQRRRLAANSSFSSFPALFPPLSLSQSAFAFTLTSHVAIRQRFNRVCAFAWKSLKLNASDGNLYASPTQRGRGKGEGQGKRRKAVVPAAPVRPCGAALQLVPKLICVGFCAGCGMAERRDGGEVCQTFCPGIFPLALLAASFCFWPSLCAFAAIAFPSQRRLVINVANAHL